LRQVCAQVEDEPLYTSLNAYNASLLTKCLKLYKKTALLADDCRVERVHQAAKDIDLPEFNQIFTRDFKGADEASFDVYLQKLCIINHLFRRDVELYLHYG
jgi:hypothetical protein